MTQESDSEPLPSAITTLLDRQQALQADLAECTAQLRQTLATTTVSGDGESVSEAGSYPGWLRSLSEQLQHAAGEGEVVEALLDAVEFLLPGSAGAVSLVTEGDARSLVAAFMAGRRWSSLPGRMGRDEDESLPERLGRDTPGQSVRVVLGGLGMTVGELRLWPGADGLKGQAESIEAVANLAAMALAGFTLRNRLRHRSVRDALTGLFNHRYLEDTLDRELHRARRNHAALGLIMFQLDDYDELRTGYGNETADRLLESVGGLLQASFRGSDVCCRFAESVFCVVLPDASLDGTARRAEALRQQLGEIRMGRHTDAATPSASFGVGAFPGHAETPEALISAAESAVYRASQAGGGQVVRAERPDLS